jgi:hypothetical protein
MVKPRAKEYKELAVFRDVTQCGSCKNRRLGRTIASIFRVTRISELRTTLAVTSNRSTLPRKIQYFPENDIHHGHRRENLKSYIRMFSFCTRLYSNNE